MLQVIWLLIHIFGGNQYDYGFSGRRRFWNGTNGIADSNYDLSQTDGSTVTRKLFNLGVRFN
jgi:hypothetical protein